MRKSSANQTATLLLIKTQRAADTVIKRYHFQYFPCKTEAHYTVY